MEIPSPPPEFGFPANSFPLSMDLLDNMLYIGDRNTFNLTAFFEAQGYILLSNKIKQSREGLGFRDEE